MPWQQGGNGGSGGGPWGGGGGGGGGPWGRGSGGGRPPDFEDFIRRGQDRFKRFLPAGGGGGRGLLVVGAALLVLWMLSGFYRVQPDQQGVVLRFGQWVTTTQPGLNWHMPYPIESVDTPSVEAINSIDVGFRPVGGTTRGSSRRDVEEESLMLTGDQNIIDIDFTVLWKISDAGRFLFNIRDPEQTVKAAAESAMREIIARTDIQPALTEGRQDIEIKSRELLQAMLSEYQAGIEITQVQLQEVQPPAQVIDAFSDVQRALQDRDRLRNEADAYRNDILPRARGEAQRMIQEAQAYRERLINEADGEAQRFLSVYEAYQQNPQVTRRRMYLETMQQVFQESDTVILDSKSGGVVPYLPLDQLQRDRKSQTSPTSGPASGQGQ